MRKNIKKLVAKAEPKSAADREFQEMKRDASSASWIFNGLILVFTELAEVKRAFRPVQGAASIEECNKRYEIMVNVILHHAAHMSAIETVEDMSEGFPAEGSAAVSMVWWTSQKYYRALRELSDAGMVGQRIRCLDVPNLDWIEVRMGLVLSQLGPAMFAQGVDRLRKLGVLGADAGEVERLLGLAASSSVTRSAIAA